MNKPLRILGIDPGSRITGFGIIDVVGREHFYVASGCINNKAFAFCRVDHATDPNRKGYWWFGLVDGKVVPLPVNRL